MNRNTGILVAIMAIAIMASAADAQIMDLKNSASFKDHNFAIAKFMVNGTAGTPKALEFATVEEPLVILAENQSILISLREWGIDSSRAGVLLKVYNGSDPNYTGYMVPLQRGWGTQIDEVTFGDLKIRVGLTEVFRGKTAEWAKFCVTAIKVPAK